MYRALLRSGMKRASGASGDTNTLRARLAALASDAERLKALVELAQEDIAAVLALPGASSVPADVPLKELGLDSLMAVELRNRLSARVGTKLPTTLAFDYPTPTAMAQLLLEKLELGRGLVRVERRRAVDAATAASEAIAIVGMSCRAPRDLTSPESYWELLASGGEGVGPLPTRWSRELRRRLEMAHGGLGSRRRLPRCGGGIRRGVLWHLAAGSARDGPAAAVDPGSGVGGAGACGNPTGALREKSQWRVSRLCRQRLWSGYTLARSDDHVDGDGHDVERAGGTRVVRLGSRGPGDDGRYGVLVIAHRAALGVRGAPARRVRAGAGRWCSVMCYARDVGRHGDGRWMRAMAAARHFRPGRMVRGGRKAAGYWC